MNFASKIFVGSLTALILSSCTSHSVPQSESTSQSNSSSDQSVKWNHKTYENFLSFDYPGDANMQEEDTERYHHIVGNNVPKDKNAIDITGPQIGAGQYAFVVDIADKSKKTIPCDKATIVSGAGTGDVPPSSVTAIEVSGYKGYKWNHPGIVMCFATNKYVVRAGVETLVPGLADQFLNSFKVEK